MEGTWSSTEVPPSEVYLHIRDADGCFDTPGCQSGTLGADFTFDFHTLPTIEAGSHAGTIEILATQLNSWGFVVVEPDGTVSDVTGHPMRQGLSASPMVDDIDNDGLLEIVAASGDANENGEIRIWDESGPATSALPWPMFHHDIARTGLSTPRPALGFPGEIRVFHQQGSGTSESRLFSIWNEGGGAFDWTLTPSTGLIQVAPASGTLTKTTSVQLTVDTSGLANGWTEIGQVTATATDAGGEIAGSPQTAPVSVYVGDVQHVYLPTISRRQ